MESQDEEGREDRELELSSQLKSVVSELTPFQRRFIVKFLSQSGPPDATLAYQEAGGRAKHANRAAYNVRHHPRVRAAIDELFHQQEMSAGEVIARLSEQARAEYAAYLKYDEERDLTFVDVQEMLANGKGHLIKGVKWMRTGPDSAEQVVEFYDAHQALVDVGKYHGLFGPKGDVDDPLHSVGMTLEEWKAEQEQKRRQREGETAETLGIFEEVDEDA